MNTTYPEVESSIGMPPEGSGAVADAQSSVANRAKEAASAAMRKGEDAAAYVGSKAEDAASSVGGALKSLGETVREKAPHSGMTGGATSAVAQSLERTGEYLQNEGLSGIAEDITGVVRRNPIPALLAAIGVGFLIAQATSRRS